jgi:hypothetical protein
LLQKSERVSAYTKKINPNHIKIIKEKAFNKKESIQQIINLKKMIKIHLRLIKNQYNQNQI